MSEELPIVDESAIADTMVVDALPLEEPGSRQEEPQNRQRSVASFFFGGIFTALARPRILLFLMGMSLVLPLIVALPTFFAADQHLSNFEAIPGGAPLEMPEHIPAWIFEEWRHAASSEMGVIAQTIAPLLLLVSLLNLVITAGWMRMANPRRRSHSLRDFLQCGGHFFFPFLRTWIFGLPLFALATWIFWGMPAEWVFERIMPDGKAALAGSEQTGRWMEILRQVLYLLTLWKIEILLDIARASMICGNRRSALLAMLRSFGFMLRRPFPVFGMMALGFGLELVWIAGAEAGREALSWPVWTLLLILPFGRIVLRGARYVGLVGYVAERTQTWPLEEEEATSPNAAT